MNQEKIKEIAKKIKNHYVIIDTEGTGNIGAEQALQEYGNYIRQQTLEESEIKSPELFKEIKTQTGQSIRNVKAITTYLDGIVVATDDGLYTNVEALKDKN